jgi:hypothetical protein
MTQTTKTVRLESSEAMGDKVCKKAGFPTWWARIGSGKDAQFLHVGRVSGCLFLDVEVEVDTDVTEIHIGVGDKDSRFSIREAIAV